MEKRTIEDIITLEQIAHLVERRKIIDHGSIRCLWSQEAIASIEQVDSDEIGTGTIGDNALAAKVLSLEGSQAEKVRWAIYKSKAYEGDTLADYIAPPEKEDDISDLDYFIEFVSDLVSQLDENQD